ncbi:cupin domain-containing protein [Halalkalicoccus salilacus]|uniref:cupin domain-containing protein n=1 Tax=Halalkalicoccus TaxID=332246 RepID=UPI002F96E744
MVRNINTDEIPTVHNLRNTPVSTEREGFEQTIFRGMDQMVAITTIGPSHKDRSTHSHPWEQVNILLEGELDLIVGDERVSLDPYDAMVIPPNVEHASRVTSTESATLLAHWPIREDRLEATEYQQEFDV